MHIIGLKEFRANVDKVAKRVERGEPVTVVKRSRPLFTLYPPDRTEERWEQVIDFTQIEPEGVDIEKVLSRLRRLNASDR